MLQSPASGAHDLFHHRWPDFLVISPPKTGSTWLAANLRHHPQLFIPEVKEVRYFSSFFKWLDPDWYCRHFAPAGNRWAGEASPSYAALPLARIRALRHLLPDLKLVFLMRDPVARAWSHAKHNRAYNEANFTDALPDGETTGDQWRANFVHDWPLVSGDYLGQLRRWASVFPAEQLYVGFYESIATRPAELLRDVFRFLGVDFGVDLSGFPVRERILPGRSGQLPAELTPFLRGVLQDRTKELVEYLRDRFGLTAPPEWATTLDQPIAHLMDAPPAFRQEADDEYLAGVMRLEETFASNFRFIEEDYRGYDIAFFRGGLYGVLRTRGAVTLVCDEHTRAQCIQEGTCLVAPTLSELKERITTRLLQDSAARVRVIEEDLRATREVTGRLTGELAEVLAVMRRASLARRVLRKIRESTRPKKLLARARPS